MTLRGKCGISEGNVKDEIEQTATKLMELLNKEDCVALCTFCEAGTDDQVHVDSYTLADPEDADLIGLMLAEWLSDYATGCAWNHEMLASFLSLLMMTTMENYSRQEMRQRQRPVPGEKPHLRVVPKRGDRTRRGKKT